jgi:D-tyrosyl-tRNA(Tyr) deacylase
MEPGAPGEISQPLFARFVEKLAIELGKPVPTGVFGADMQVSLINDGPVTLSIDSRAPGFSLRIRIGPP